MPWPTTCLIARFLFNLVDDGPRLPAPNVSPTHGVLTVRHSEEDRIGTATQWRLVPFWAKDASIAYKTINARSETVVSKPAFRGAFKSRRCLIPALGFYEWAHDGDRGQPHFFRLASHEPFAMAGIWETWRSPAGDELVSCSILATEANGLVGAAHPRMPLILTPEAEATWLELSAPPELLLELARPHPADRMESYPVTPAVNTPRYQGMDSVQPLPT